MTDPDFRRLQVRVAGLRGSLEAFGAAIRRAHFAWLDVAEAEGIDVAAQPPSWEIEREAFLRRLDAEDGDEHW